MVRRPGVFQDQGASLLGPDVDRLSTKIDPGAVQELHHRQIQLFRQEEKQPFHLDPDTGFQK